MSIISSVNSIRVSKSFVLGYCKCNCNTQINLRTYNGYLKKYKEGHGNSGKPQINKSGSEHWNWKGGIIKGRYLRYRIKQGKYKVLHRIIYEQYYKCCLLSWVDLHHINGNKKDNRIENLQPIPHDKHARYHMTKL